MATKFNMVRDINGYNGFGLQFTDTAYSATLATSTNTTLTVPSNSGMGGNGFQSSSTWIAIFSFDSGSNVWVANNVAAELPSGAAFVETSSELNPKARLVKGGDVLNFISDGTDVNISVMFYSLS